MLTNSHPPTPLASTCSSNKPEIVNMKTIIAICYQNNYYYTCLKA